MKTAVVLQCRLSSKRLPGKALLPMGQFNVFERVLEAMKKVPADSYIVATDSSSAPELSPFAGKHGYEIFEGSLDDVLNRYCSVIKKYSIDVVVRGTCDNPFLFHEAACDLLEEFIQLKKTDSIDYMTYTGLPHGSGVEVFDASSLLKAELMTDSPYDHEHVGPALYNHRDKFNCIFTEAAEKYRHPELRTTTDTLKDYRRNLTALEFLGKDEPGPFTTEQIVNVFSKECVSKPFIFIPCIEQGHGTGHLRRCLSLAVQTGGSILIPDETPYEKIEQLDSILNEYMGNGLKSWQVRNSLVCLEEYEVVFTDLFVTDKRMKKALASCNTVAIDEGSSDKDFADFTFDVLPPLKQDSNFCSPFLIPLPEKRKNQPVAQIKKVLVCVGGEDRQQLGRKASDALSALGYEVTHVTSSSPVKNLKEELCCYDLVVTHFGFTAFEALSAGCAVILAATTPLHKKLSLKNGFAVLDKNELNEKSFRKLLAGGVNSLRPDEKKLSSASGLKLPDVVKKLTAGHFYSCPVCRSESHENPVTARIPERTFRKCRNCGMTYISFAADEKETVYDHDYFFDSYRAQYGKTYLEDFESIKAQGLRRSRNILKLGLKTGRIKTERKSVLDIGCAMGPFLAAARDCGFECYGTDINAEAVQYVNSLGIKACTSSFPDFSPDELFGKNSFDAVTMWFVIEHFQNLGKVLEKVSSLVSPGGIFAFGTPSASGVSARFNRDSFFASSPADHFSLWEISEASAIMKRYGFRIEKIVPTGIHPERFPHASALKPDSLRFRALSFFSRFFKLGDTFEVYCRKVK